MSIFKETMIKAVNSYRVVLRRDLSQSERMLKLKMLNLRSKEVFKSDVALYHVGQGIVADIRQNMLKPIQGYYSYSGVAQFCEYLEEYLSHYYIEKGRVVHRAQLASRAILDSIQLASIAREELNDSIMKRFYRCNEIIVDFGSSEQCDFQLQLLEREQASHPGFYTQLIAHLESLRNGRAAAAA
ncbi:MAG: hypothetical protein A3I77_04935 [Gammaproteobacteria bacterium RIFCSPLOWO2_02_FULL_42_14]|nr:MAG: hypothetical protein A3B71_06235 [Gammaproteobacteria bacterium RIFCSPHIGHO2_02_FULL_42_43]OGT28689.1 MAG: hypothetical protein A2624_01035 [Gammaproteobacteria bacterium RIFCSPHIGHO2_01_FULL_42_8]OGT51579.1 MAG: hypothetical protein A3E54_06000 [Gammaproteobacteria bacterium RIFCSPHIGHO2_12_FULL_41_25]OGT62278.1 MAG: hypothetical protein A3I77_04935 [Gammaproteobacteria bacterium RIFCSPLOWO2_02_FULL_42_14]OGT85952.1 MAG: hypothetical protein A3G86_04625 [Gammaproteobacteria bacterium R